MNDAIGVAAADLHLAPTTWKKHPALRGDSYCGLTHVVDSALRYQVPLFLLGDIFDQALPDSESVLVFCREMDRMRTASLPVAYIQGNHDYADPPWPSVHPWPQWLHKQSRRLADLCFYGLDYTPRGRLQEELAAVPVGTDVLLMHQAWEEMQRVGHTDGSFADVHHARYLVVGDYHVNGTWQGITASGGPLEVHSPGSTCMRAVNESPAKFCYLLHAEGSRRLRASLIPLPARTFLTLEVNCPEELVAAERRLLEGARTPGLSVEIEKPAVRIQYRDAVPDVYARLAAAAGERFHVFWDPRHESADVSVPVPALLGPDFDTLASVLEYMRANGTIPAEVYTSASRLLRSGNTQAELAAIAAELQASYTNQTFQSGSGHAIGVA